MGYVYSPEALARLLELRGLDLADLVEIQETPDSGEPDAEAWTGLKTQERS